MPRRPKPHPKSLAVGAVLTVLVALGQISTSVYIPSMPSLVGALETTPDRVNLTLSVFLAGFAVSQLVYGPLSDRYGRRRVLVGGLSLFLLASLACTAANSIEALSAARFVQAVGACSGPVLGRAIVRDVYGGAGAAKAMAYIGVAFAISPAITPIIGGYLQVWFGWRANFVFLAFVAVAVQSAVLLMLEETRPDPGFRTFRLRDMARSYMKLVTSPVYMGYALSVAFVFAGLMAYTAVAPFVFIDLLAIPPDTFGLLSLFNVLGFLGGSITAGRLTMKLGPARMVLIGIGLAAVGGTAMSLIALAGHLSVAAVIGPMIFFMAGMGIVFPNALAGAMAPFPYTAGAASALVGFLQMSVAAAAAAFAGRLPIDSQTPMALVIAGAVALALIAFLTLAWPRRFKAEGRQGPEDAPPP